ncbi:TlpA family protein disulfide reductase [Cryobacterium tepidiphilum]|uniref:TlpA family protein disulfide reductase n=1 Tax=Cryobacterium tepidiphilum TaxID=2486026 RepID=A0A3M8LBF0_9MICO|nr:TlpA disulfide reductase family protein [Cryobacterium tepidiphilum]RNE62092.1 TlpA family protein disulfide reductase [Cryobacterium tepidiphilum]
MRLHRLALVVAGVVTAATLALTGCSSDPLAEQYRAGTNKGYIAGDGSVTEIPAAKRGEPVEFSGTTASGDTVTSHELAGTVVVLNFWYAGCAPCRAEAPDLAKLSEEFDGKGAQFLGVNVRDQAASVTAFNASYDIRYPSVLDVNDGSMQQAFSGTIPPNAVPTTLVLDGSGRVAARILGELEAPSILETLIRDTIAEAG